MSFVDRDFAWFVLAAITAWWLVRGHYQLQIAVMIGMSLFFYGFHQWWLPLVLVVYAVVDWGIALWMGGTVHRKQVLALGIAFNLGLLALWKYLPWFEPDVAGNWILPMGMSFYAFSGISYMVDVCRQEIPAERNFFRYLLFTSFFPHLMAGPILRAREFLTDLIPAKLPTRPDSPLEGTILIARGFFKKLVLADGIAVVVDPFFGNVSGISTEGVWSLPFLYLYALQIYCDFSGYIDIARGLGLWFGFRWPENFNLPYLAGSVQDFWRRWHMTLSRFLRDYLYIPLGGNRHGAWRAGLNLMITMTLGGLWHGAGPGFLVWGSLHGAYLVINHLWNSSAPGQTMAALTGFPRKVWRVLWVVFTFHVVTLTWSFFRLPNVGEALTCLGKVVHFEPARMFGGGAMALSLWLPILIWILFSGVLLIFSKRASLAEWVQKCPPASFSRGMAWGAALGLLLLAMLLARTGEKPAFIYFQF